MTPPPEAAPAGDLLESLNPQQREAVLAHEGATLILAGAGSGKTRVIIHRLAYLVREKGVAPRALLAVTFTNKAAGEMKERAEKLLGGSALESWICTFHSFCVRLLRRYAVEAGVEPGFMIWDADDQIEAVKLALRALQLPEKLYPPRRLLSDISAAKNSGRVPRGEDGSPWQETLVHVAERYQQQLHASRALDFDDLLLKAAQLLEKDERVRTLLRERFRYVLVDEYQDTNRVQYDLVRHLVGPEGNITVVGDEDQSIYSWRGADIQNILDFERDFPGARVLRLEENYRSSQAILDAAGSVVAHNRQRKGKTLRATKEGGDPVRLHQAGDEYQEASWVVGQIGRARSERSAVLYRMNAQSRLFEEALMRQGIPYSVVGGVGFYERREVKDLLAYLRLVVTPDDSMALRRVVNVPARGIGERTVEHLQELAATRGISLWLALQQVDDQDLLPARTTLALRRFRVLIDQLRVEAASLTVKGLLERALHLTGYAGALAADDSHESQDRLENLAELLSAAADFDAREEAPSLAAFLDRVTLLSETDLVRGDAPVVLMTLHSAKGLEFDAIYLVGLEEGLVPHSRSHGSREGLEEERRLCYVGMTRARQRLSLTWARNRRVFGQRRTTEPSRFLFEVPRDSLLISADDDYGAPEPERPARRRPEYPRQPDVVVAPAAAELEELRPGVRVRHPLFGEGTVVQSEGAGLEKKLTVSFRGVGAKRLVARYAALEVL